jgi:hypothetical protein
VSELGDVFEIMLDEHDPEWRCWRDQPPGHSTEQIAEALALEAADIALNAVPCRCIEGFWARNLEDPLCQHHDLARALGVPERSPHASPT